MNYIITIILLILSFHSYTQQENDWNIYNDDNRKYLLNGQIISFNSHIFTAMFNEDYKNIDFVKNTTFSVTFSTAAVFLNGFIKNDLTTPQIVYGISSIIVGTTISILIMYDVQKKERKKYL